MSREGSRSRGPQAGGTESLLHDIGAVWRRPSLLAIEVGWRWLAAAPLLALAWARLGGVVQSLPLESTGIRSFSLSDPWRAAEVLAGTAALLLPPLRRLALWLLPLSAVVWSLACGLGRTLVLRRYDPALPARLLAQAALQLLRLAAMGLMLLLWWRSVEWAAATSIAAPLAAGREADLLGYLAKVIVSSLAVFTAWLFAGWVFLIAPLLLLLEGGSTGSSVGSSLRRSLSLGRELTGKLVEVNLVMGIIKLALLVLAMVFSATPLPFEAEMSGTALRAWWVFVACLYAVANDFFQLARVISFLELWRRQRTAGRGAAPGRTILAAETLF